MTERRDDIWFPAKRYGWGWGLPVAWQGWVVLVVYFALFGVGLAVFDAERQTLGLLAYTSAITAALIAVCWRKGETPRWRWGGD